MAAANQGNPETAQSVYEFNVKDIKGNDVSLEKYKGHVLIIVNVASKCGYTAKHYAELNELYDQYAESKGELSLTINCMFAKRLSYLLLSMTFARTNRVRVQSKFNSLPRVFLPNVIRIKDAVEGKL